MGLANVDKPKYKYDPAIQDLVEALDSLDGISVCGGSCYDGNQPLTIFFHMDSTSVGAHILMHCMSGRYCSYAKGDKRSDMEWVVKLADGDTEVGFQLTGPRMFVDPSGTDPRIQNLIANINQFHKSGNKKWRRKYSKSLRNHFKLTHPMDNIRDALE